MNIKSIVSFLFAGGVFLAATLTATDNPKAFMDLHAVLIVIGGTISAAAISFQVDRLLFMIKVFFYRVVRGRKFEYIPLIRAMMEIAEAYRTNSPKLEQMISDIKDPFLKEGMTMLVEQIMDEEDLFRIMETRAATISHRYQQEAMMFKSIAKYPPAFGLLGATIGMIALLQGLGTAEGQANIGPAMSVALVGTLYGIAFANFCVLPIAENLLESSKEVHTKNRIIVEGIRVIAARKNPIMLAEDLNSFLLAGERIDWRSMKGSGSGGGGMSDAA